MTLSRMTALLILAGSVAPGQAQESVTADEVTANYRRMFPPIDLLDCPPGAEDEVVICARRMRQSPRLPLPQEPPEGQRMAGQPPSAANVVNRSDRCSTVGPNQSCSGGLPFAPAVIFVGKLIGKLIGGGE